MPHKRLWLPIDQNRRAANSCDSRKFVAKVLRGSLPLKRIGRWTSVRGLEAANSQLLMSGGIIDGFLFQRAEDRETGPR